MSKDKLIFQGVHTWVTEGWQFSTLSPKNHLCGVSCLLHRWGRSSTLLIPSKELSEPLVLTLLNGQPCKPSRLSVGIGFVALGALFFFGFVDFYLCACVCTFYRKMVGMVLTGAGKVEDKPAAMALHVQAVLATLSLTSVGFSSALQKAKFGKKWHNSNLRTAGGFQWHRALLWSDVWRKHWSWSQSKFITVPQQIVKFKCVSSTCHFSWLQSAWIDITRINQRTE